VISLADRLRDVVRPVVLRRADDSHQTDEMVDARHDATAETLEGEWRESRGQRYLVIDRKYSAGYRHGAVAVADALPPIQDGWPKLSLLAGMRCVGRMLFVDLETTGLAGGAGSYAFLVGCGWFESGTFRVRQFFLADFSGERALLEAVAEIADSAGTVVTFNGKSFDLPLLETRFVMNRLATPFAGMPHVDMLHPARRLWKADGVDSPGFGLSALDETQCGHVREGDVPGFAIPSRYFHYVRSGDARGLGAVVEHNRLDLLSLALLTARASQLLDDGPTTARTAREAIGIGRLYERAGLLSDACASFEQATTLSACDASARAEAFHAYALVLRRQRRFRDAAAAWSALLAIPGCPVRFAREAMTALAVHHEHRVRDLPSARAFALESIQGEHSLSRRQAVEYRLARLDRKLEDVARVGQLF
jgi:uncharacterized protein YprB with RNaseH-like and TPR domain